MKDYNVLQSPERKYFFVKEFFCKVYTVNIYIEKRKDIEQHMLQISAKVYFQFQRKQHAHSIVETCRYGNCCMTSLNGGKLIVAMIHIFLNAHACCM